MMDYEKKVKIKDENFNKILAEGEKQMKILRKTFEELQSDLKSYASLPVTQGQIRTSPGIKQRIQAFIQWTRDKIRIGEDPSAEPFPVHRTSELIRNYKSHQAFIEKSKTLIDTAKPSKFKDTYKWED